MNTMAAVSRSTSPPTTQRAEARKDPKWHTRTTNPRRHEAQCGRRPFDQPVVKRVEVQPTARRMGICSDRGSRRRHRRSVGRSDAGLWRPFLPGVNVPSGHSRPALTNTKGGWSEHRWSNTGKARRDRAGRRVSHRYTDVECVGPPCPARARCARHNREQR